MTYVVTQHVPEYSFSGYRVIPSAFLTYRFFQFLVYSHANISLGIIKIFPTYFHSMILSISPENIRYFHWIKLYYNTRSREKLIFHSLYGSVRIFLFSSIFEFSIFWVTSVSIYTRKSRNFGNTTSIYALGKYHF